MASAPLIRRSRSGIIEIVPSDVAPPRGVRWAVIFGVILLTKALYLSTLIPASEFALILACCVVTELGIMLRQSELSLAPKARVLALERARAAGPRASR